MFKTYYAKQRMMSQGEMNTVLVLHGEESGPAAPGCY